MDVLSCRLCSCIYIHYPCVFVFVCVYMCVCIQVARNLLNFGIGRLRLVDCQVPLDACYNQVSRRARASANVLTRTVRLTVSRDIFACGACARVRALISATMSRAM